jgi:alpha-galactosidase
VALYREIRPVVHAGEVTWHGSPGDPACAVQYSTADRIVLLAWSRPGAGPLRVPLAPDARVRHPDTASPASGPRESGVPRGRVVHPSTAVPAFQHDSAPRFRVRGTGELVGTEVEVPFRLAPDCDVVILDRVAHD